MGASRKLQGEIDRVLKKVQEGVDVFDSIWNKVYETDNANQKEKFEADLKKEIKKLQRYRDQIKTWIQSSEIKDKKVSASYEQALLDARKQIEREMERFKVCEKETKTKAFSKEGLVQQPKTDPKEKAKSETRDWLNNVVGELESQIDYFEADIEGLSIKKGKSRPPRLTHLETSITRHKAHIMKLELILRLLDNDELSPEQVNDVRDFLEDYVERNQDDFEEFSDVDELYVSLPLDKVESLEDLVTVVPPGLAKVTLASTAQQGSSVQESAEETASQGSNSEITPRTPPSKNVATGSLISSVPAVSHATAVTGNVPAASASSSAASGIHADPGIDQVALDKSAASISSSPAVISSLSKEEENTTFSSHKSSPALAETGLGRGTGRGSVVGETYIQSSINIPTSSSGNVASDGSFGAPPSPSDMANRNIFGADERMGSAQPLLSPLSNRMLFPQVSKSNDGTGATDSGNGNVGEAAALGGKFMSPPVPGAQWRPHSGSSFQNMNDLNQYRGRTEIAPDQREKFLERLQQVQQQGHSNILGMSHLAGGKQFSTPQLNSLLQQFNSQNTSLSHQVGPSHGGQSSGLNVSAASLQQLNSVHQIPTQHALASTGPADSDVGHVIAEEQQQQQQQQQYLSDDSGMEPTMSSGLNMNDDVKTAYAVDKSVGGSGSLSEASQVSRDIDLSPGQPLQSSQSSANLGVIGRRSVADLGAIGDNLGGSTAVSGGTHDQMYNLQMLEAAYYKLPQPKDSERAKTYIPKHPVGTPSSYPQVQAPIVDNLAFWERPDGDLLGTDMLFFTFYHQQNTYQQYLAAKELKKQSWRYHRKYNTWFQRHEEPKLATDEYEQGTYVYFDFHIANDELNHGWCQRIKAEFVFEYSYLEDELSL